MKSEKRFSHEFIRFKNIMEVSWENAIYTKCQALVTDQSQIAWQASNLPLLPGSGRKEVQRLCRVSTNR